MKKTLLILLVLLSAPIAALARGAAIAGHMQALSDGELSAVSGAGLAIALDNFSFMMAPTSYAEQVGSDPSPLCSGSGTSSSNLNCWRRGDLRWYGVNISGAGGTGSNWNESSCDASSLACPRGGAISWFSPFDNPYLVRAWSPQGMAYDGSLINTDPANPGKTIYEFLAPTNQPDYTFSFWGEIEAGATRDPSVQPLSSGQGVANGGGLLKSQTIIRGNAAGSIFRVFKYTETGNETFAMYYRSHLQGDFRFSVAQAPGGDTDAIGAPALFDGQEGLTFRNVDALIPFGQLYYQALVLDAVGTDGNFSITLTPIPDNPTVYGRFYALASGDSLGYETARAAVASWNTSCTTTQCELYRQSHGYIRYGDFYPGSNSWSASGTRNAIDSDSDGIVFKACSGCSTFNAFAKRSEIIDKRGENYSRQLTQNYNCATGNTGGCSVSASGGPEYSGSPGDDTRTFPTTQVNLGDARVEGLLINQLTIASCQSGGC